MQYKDLDINAQKNLIKEYFDKEIETIQRLDIEEINNALNAIYDAYLRDANIYIFGNGGSAATASHYVCDFNKGISSNKDKKFNLICLNDNTPIITAIANDISYDEIFRHQLINKLKPSDLVIAISGSGNSKNIINAVEYAKEIGTKVVGITGYDGGKLKKLADYHLDANIDDMQISEDIHMMLCHLTYSIMMNGLGANPKNLTCV